MRLSIYLSLMVALFAGPAAWAQSISISSPGSTSSSPVRVTASASSSTPVWLMQVYVDGSKKYEVKGSKVDTQLSLSSGTRRITIVAHDSDSVAKKTVETSVSGTSTTSSSTSSSSTCSASSGVTICSPSDGGSSSSPVRVIAAGGDSSGIDYMQIYVDGSKVGTYSGGSLDKSVSMSSGTRKLTVQARANDGSLHKRTVYVTVSGSTSSGSTSSSGENVYRDVEEMSGWDDCDVCSGPGGEGDSISYSMSRGQSSPSRDGNSTKFTIAANDSSDDYGSALWWKHLGGDDRSANFVYETYFYLKDPTKSQALEFDINQSHAGDNTKYIFGTECDIRGTKQWRYYDNVDRTWRTTGVACSVPQAYTWNHLILEFRRGSDDTLHFLTVTLNGKKSYFNKTSAPKRNTASNAHINIAFQIDGNSRTDKYDVWLDDLTLRHW